MVRRALDEGSWTYPFLVLTGLSFTLPDSEYPWTATPVTLSLPIPDALAYASGHVSACCPRPALPVFYRPPVNSNNSRLLSHSPLCNPWACIPYQQGSTSPSCLLFPNWPLRSSCPQQLAPRSLAGKYTAASADAWNLFPRHLPFLQCF